MISITNITKLLSIPLVIALLVPQSSNHTAGHKVQTNDNDHGLNDEFALGNGPRFVLPHQQQALVDQVIEEMKKGYGGTLVTRTGPDNTLDSSSFLSRYLREFSSLENKRGLRPDLYDALCVSLRTSDAFSAGLPKLGYRALASPTAPPAIERQSRKIFSEPGRGMFCGPSASLVQDPHAGLGRIAAVLQSSAASSEPAWLDARRTSPSLFSSGPAVTYVLGHYTQHLGNVSV